MPVNKTNAPIKIKTKFKIQLETIIKGILFFCVLGLPLYIGLGGMGIIDFNKQLFMTFFACSAFLLWLLSAIFNGSFRWRPQILTLLTFAFLIATFASTILSRWQWGSFWGWPLDSAFSFITILCFFAFYLLIANVFENPKGILFLQFLLVISGFLVALIGSLQLFGKFILPWDFTKATSFNPIGTVNSWALFLAVLICPVLTLLFITKGLARISLMILGVFILIGLFICNYWVAWVGVLFSTALLLAFGLWKFKEIGSKFLIIPIILFSIALLFGVLKIPVPALIATPLEVSPSQRATFDVVKDMLKISTKDLILGWGPGTFRYGWSKFKSPVLNQTIFWNLRFSKGSSEMSEMLGTVGILGTTLYILIILFAIYLGIKHFLKLEKEKQSSEWMLFLGTFCSFIALSLIKFLYPANVALGFIWWILLGSLSALVPAKERVLKLTADSKVAFLFSLITILFSTGSILLFYLTGTRYLSELKYNQALMAQDSATAEKRLLEAITLNPNQEMLFRDLSQIYLARANEEALKTDVTNEERTQKVSGLVANAVMAVGRSTDINPENVVNWQARAAIYREIIGWSQGAFEWAKTCYERALELEPTNPFILVSMGRAYLIQGNTVSEASEKEPLLNQAEELIKKSIGLKPDYAPAFYQMALVYQAQGKMQEAIATLESLKQASAFLLEYNPLEDVGLAFQLGILYYQDEQYEKAQGEFERAVNLNPAYSNARYFLGLIYDRNNQKDKAIEQFKEIEKYNPGNEEIKKILTNLAEGRPALEEIITTPETLPIEEGPEEQ